METAPDVLGTDRRAPFFPIANAHDIGLEAPTDRLGIPVRTWVRALAGMQKEALVINGATGRAWRLISDEGPYLSGHDRAPCPLCTFTTGMVASYMNEVTALAAVRGLELGDPQLTLGNHYSMEGSALRGTMVAGAMPPELDVEIGTDAATADLAALARDAVTASPVNGLLSGIQDSLFTLGWNGSQIPVSRVGALDGDLLADPGPAFDQAEVAADDVADDLMVKVRPADEIEGVPGGVGTSLQDSQSRTLHVQARCRMKEDGIKVIQENLFRPIGSEFRFLSDEAPEAGGGGRAPDALSYVAAGLAFCFMTQFGRYASITKKRLDGYRVVQDMHFSRGRSGEPGAAAPVETHVYLDTAEDAAFAQKILDMGERTCFLHATCRTDLDVALTVTHKT